MELTASERKVLNGISFNTEEIESGNLCDKDMALLNEMRTVEKYLAEKYPSFSFEITGCEPKSGTAREYSEWYYKVAEIDRESGFIAMSEEKNGSFEIKDAFFGQLIKDSIRDKLKDILESNGLPVISIDVSFWDYLGKEFDETISAEKVLKGEITAGNDFKIFLDGSMLSDTDYQATLNKIKELLQKEGVQGEIYLIILKSADSDYAKDRLFSGSLVLGR